MPELLQEQGNEVNQKSVQQGAEPTTVSDQKEILDVKEDSSSELEVDSREVEGGLEVDLTERTITQRVEKFVEDGEEKKLIDIDESEDSKTNLIKRPGERYQDVMPHPLSLVPEPETAEVDFSPAMHRWRLFSLLPKEQVEEVDVSFPQVPEIKQKSIETGVSEPEDVQLRQVEEILENDSVLEKRPEDQLNSEYEDSYDEYTEEAISEDDEDDTVLDSSEPSQEELSEGYELEAFETPSTIEVEDDAALVAFDVTGYDLSTLEDGEQPKSPLVRYIDEEGLEEFSILSENLLHAEYLPEETDDGIHQRLVYKVEEEVGGSTVKQVAEYLSETAPVEVEVEAQNFYSDEEFMMGGELKEPGEYTVHGFDLEGMDENMTEFRVNNELAEDSIEHVEVETGDYVDFVEAEVYSGHA